MKIMVMLCLCILGSGCATKEVCDGHLRPINVPVRSGL